MKLVEYLDGGVSPFHVVALCKKEFDKGGFVQLGMEEEWKLEAGGKYYVDQHGSTLIAFTLPEKKQMLPQKSKAPCLRISASHTDFPCLRIKAKPDMHTEHYGKLNTEVYGGAINASWLDRPLGVAGRVAIASKDPFCPDVRIYDSKRPILTIPNLAIHMDRETNKGKEINRQTELIPIFTTRAEEDEFVTFLAKELKVAKEDILDFELTCYNAEKSQEVGIYSEMLSAPRIDNISSVAAMAEAMLHTKKSKSVNVAAFFDHEEIGSTTKQGADSLLLSDVITRIYDGMGFGEDERKRAIYDGFLLSVDVAHAMHPNHVNKADVTNHPYMNGGLCIKEASGQSYATDCEAIAIVEQMAKKKNITYQKFLNRSDVPGGHTLGVFAASFLPMRAVDIGVPILAMHSARELMGKDDYDSIEKLIEVFYQL
ncbi:MAG: M18 family aminopeptidase [Lachnospiraceae bacterium]|nr:M18 family aminopeptidase [Lachnospiraceae bacterium]